MPMPFNFGAYHVLKLALRVAARKGGPETKPIAYRLFDRVLDERHSEFASELLQVAGDENWNLDSLYYDAWHEYRLEQKRVIREISKASKCQANVAKEG